MDLEDAVQRLVDNYNFRPGRKYELQIIRDRDKNGGTLWDRETYIPIRTIELPRNPPSGYTSIYDLRDRKDFFQYFENRFPDLPDGRYTALTSRGGNDGFAWFFLLEYRGGEVTEWWKKSKATNTRQNSSSYFALPDYFRIREDWGV